jgi:uncharacterized SAM-binding protein YcdF (DUF218 family)
VIASRARRTGGAALAALGLLYVTVSATPLVDWWARALAGRWEDPGGDVLIVLGGGQFEDGIVSESSYLRSVYAVRAFRSGAIQRILVSGGPPQHPVSAAMRDFMAGSGVPREIITLETQSDSTRENALATARILNRDSGRKVLLTSDYHMFRAARSFAKAGLAVRPRPVPDAIKRAARWPGRWPAFLDLCLESAKIAYYAIRGWI